MFNFPIARTLSNFEHKVGQAVSNYALKFSTNKNKMSPSDKLPDNFAQQSHDRTQANDNLWLKKTMKSYKKGGIVHSTGPAYLHKGEFVVPKHKVQDWLMSDSGMMKGK